MKMFMPAAKRPVLFVPCCKCSNLHIKLDEVHAGGNIFCCSSDHDGDVELPHGYYSDLLCSPIGIAD